MLLNDPFPQKISVIWEQVSLLRFGLSRGKSKFSLGQIPFFLAPLPYLCHHQTAPGIKGIPTNLTEAAAPSWNSVKNTSFP